MANSNSYYTEGSAARKLNRQYREDRREQREEYVVPSKRKNRKVQISPVYGMMVVGAIILMAFVSMEYVSLQSQVTNLRKEKGVLISQYEELKKSNDLYYENMIGAVDLKEIERIAVEELGMKMADKGQVVTYSDNFDDYVKQYTDIPN